jgi:hypothetical protein
MIRPTTFQLSFPQLSENHTETLSPPDPTPAIALRQGPILSFRSLCAFQDGRHPDLSVRRYNDTPIPFTARQTHRPIPVSTSFVPLASAPEFTYAMSRRHARHDTLPFTSTLYNPAIHCFNNHVLLSSIQHNNALHQHHSSTNTHQPEPNPKSTQEPTPQQQP